MTYPSISPLAGAQSAFEAWIERLAAFESAPAPVVNDLREKIATLTFDVVVVGQFKRGKSSLINALVGADLLPVGVIPLTSVITILAYAEATSAEVVFEDGRRQVIPVEQLAEYVTERGNPNNTKSVAETRIGYPAEWLRPGIRLVDTPGVGSIHRHNTDTAYQFLPRADAVVLVLSADQPLSMEERSFLQTIGEHAGKTFILLNKMDLLEDGDVQDAMSFTRQAVEEAVGAAIAVFPVSARRALRCAGGSDASLAGSGLPELLHALDDFLQRERGMVLRHSIVRQLQRVAAQIRAGITLEWKSLTTPMDELQQKIARFEQKKNEVAIAREDSAILLGKEAIAAWMDRLDRELAAFRPVLCERLNACMDSTIAEHAALSTRRLSERLERTSVAEIRKGFDAWRSTQDQRLTQDFTAWCARHARQIDDNVDELFRFSSELFEIDYDAVRVESAWSMKSGFYYKFWDEPLSMQRLATALILALPRGLGHRALRTRFQAFAVDSIDTQCGRIRHDLLQRLEKSMRDFRRELMERIDAAISGIDAAISRGLALRRNGMQTSEERVATLRADLEALDQIAMELRQECA